MKAECRFAIIYLVAATAAVTSPHSGVATTPRLKRGVDIWRSRVQNQNKNAGVLLTCRMGEEVWPCVGEAWVFTPHWGWSMGENCMQLQQVKNGHCSCN